MILLIALMVLVGCSATACTTRYSSTRGGHRRAHDARQHLRFRTPAGAAVAGSMALLLASTGTVSAAATDVRLATARNYAVLAGTTVTNTGSSTLRGSLGVSPGSSITGFPPGLVLAPWTTDTTNAAAAQAQSDLTAGYISAAGRPLSATTAADLGDLQLQAGVYAGPSKGAIGLTGTLILDGAGDSSSVFIFQTDSSLITASGSVVRLINGAQACHVYWQVGSSATLGTGSTFVGTIMALTSISVETGVKVEGRALARNGAVTLDNDVFTRPGCASGAPATTTPTSPGNGGGTTLPGLPNSGSAVEGTLLVAAAVLFVGTAAAVIARRREPAPRHG